VGVMVVVVIVVVGCRAGWREVGAGGGEIEIVNHWNG